jgi:protein-disulfide isomerase
MAKIRKEKKMVKKFVLATIGFVFFSLILATQIFSQEDKIAQVAIETFRAQLRLPPGAEVKFVEKKESPIPGFYSVKLSVLTQNKEIPVIVYVDSVGEKVIIGSLFIRGENVSRKEAGEPKLRKMDMAQLGIEKSPSRGPINGKMTVIEFSNFQCPFCVKSWKRMKELLEKNPQEIRYIFKHFPLQPQGKPFELSEMVAATQEISDEAFWAVHDFFFSDEGQAFVSKETGVLKQKIEEILKGKGYDEKVFQEALETGKGKKRVVEDMVLGNKIGVTGTPTMIINGDFVGSSLTDKMVEQYLGK